MPSEESNRAWNDLAPSTLQSECNAMSSLTSQDGQGFVNLHHAFYGGLPGLDSSLSEQRACISAFHQMHYLVCQELKFCPFQSRFLPCSLRTIEHSQDSLLQSNHRKIWTGRPETAGSSHSSLLRLLAAGDNVLCRSDSGMDGPWSSSHSWMGHEAHVAGL